VLGATFKKIRRLVLDLKAEGLVPLIACTDCGGLVALALEDRLVESFSALDKETGEMKDRQAGGGRPVMKCKCSDRVVR
jgi:hypothetical protein